MSERLIGRKTSICKMRVLAFFVLIGAGLTGTSESSAQEPAKPPNAQSNLESPPTAQSIQDYNERLEKLRMQFAQQAHEQSADYRIGPQDLLEINVFEATELNRTVRVAESGEVSLPLLGGVRVTGLTAREMEGVLAQRLREFLKDPHVSVMVAAIESHPISVIGEVNKPGVFQVRGSKTLLEMLSMAQGVAAEAGDEVLGMRSAGFNRGPGMAQDKNSAPLSATKSSDN